LGIGVNSKDLEDEKVVQEIISEATDFLKKTSKIEDNSPSSLPRIHVIHVIPVTFVSSRASLATIHFFECTKFQGTAQEHDVRAEAANLR
jgi:hypothetical protein